MSEIRIIPSVPWKRFFIKVDMKYRPVASTPALRHIEGWSLFEASFVPSGVIEWCDEHFRAGWVSACQHQIIAIKDPHDAFAFRIRWG